MVVAIYRYGVGEICKCSLGHSAAVAAWMHRIAADCVSYMHARHIVESMNIWS